MTEQPGVEVQEEPQPDCAGAEDDADLADVEEDDS